MTRIDEEIKYGMIEVCWAEMHSVSCMWNDYLDESDC
jgi:hypothetical protein